jgi:hypothetical protein
LNQNSQILQNHEYKNLAIAWIQLSQNQQEKWNTVELNFHQHFENQEKIFNTKLFANPI